MSSSSSSGKHSDRHHSHTLLPSHHTPLCTRNVVWDRQAAAAVAAVGPTIRSHEHAAYHCPLPKHAHMAYSYYACVPLMVTAKRTCDGGVCWRAQWASHRVAQWCAKRLACLAGVLAYSTPSLPAQHLLLLLHLPSTCRSPCVSVVCRGDVLSWRSCRAGRSIVLLLHACMLRQLGCASSIVCSTS